MPDDAALMLVTLQEAAVAADREDPGFGAVICQGGDIIAAGSSAEVTRRDPLAHDGLTVIRQACTRPDRTQLEDCSFYRIAEPVRCAARPSWRGPRRRLSGTSPSHPRDRGRRRVADPEPLPFHRDEIKICSP
jgi:tRNA(Arg) A34 adenosine deaminase TadA